MTGILDELKFNFIKGSALIKLIYINVAVFILYNLGYLVFYISGNPDLYTVGYWFSVPSNLHSLALKPWTILTYMFFHQEILHILFNMLWLYWFGKIFMIYFDNRKLVAIYLLGGIIGAIFFILAYNAIPVFNPSAAFSVALGASAAVMAIVFAISFYVPNFKLHLLFFGEVKLVYIALVSIAIDLITIPKGNAGGHIAHLGGALYGFLWATQYRKGKDISLFFSKILDSIQSVFKNKNKLKVSYKKPVDDFDYNKRKVDAQKEIDRILDKISKQGYEGLTKEEKETLFKMGNKN